MKNVFLSSGNASLATLNPVKLVGSGQTKRVDRKMIWITLSLTGMLALAGCKSSRALAQQENKNTVILPQFTTGPPALLYKTKKDYSGLVPVLLSADKTRIVSYPDPRDFSNTGKYPVPLRLEKGYLLDERGIGLSVAYLKLTYEEYAALPKAPSLQEIMQLIVDKDPLTELCNCGNRLAFRDPETQLNALIRSGKLKTTCKVIK